MPDCSAEQAAHDVAVAVKNALQPAAAAAEAAAATIKSMYDTAVQDELDTSQAVIDCENEPEE